MVSTPATLPDGPSVVCLDATPLLHFNNHGLLDLLGTLFPQAAVPQFVLDREIKAPMTQKRGPQHRQNHRILKAPFVVQVHEEDEAFAERVAELKRRLGGEGMTNTGEAHVLAICERHGWTTVMEDEDGRLAANDAEDGPLVPTVYMVTALAVAAAYEIVAAKEAWEAQRAIETVRRRSIIRAEHKPVFMASVDVFKRLRPNLEPWPNVLARGVVLDQVLIKERRTP